jgi:hypothetical protein
MVLAVDYPFLDVLLTMLLVFAFVLWIWMLIVIAGDLFRRRDLGGWAKAAWCVAFLVLPFVGTLAYLVAHHDGIAERSRERTEPQRQRRDLRVGPVGTADLGGAADEIEKGHRLLTRGVISQAEFDALKARALAGRTPAA